MGMGTGAVVCKRSSSCTCPDCTASASDFGIEELRQLGSNFSTASRGVEDATAMVNGDVDANGADSHHSGENGECLSSDEVAGNAHTGYGGEDPAGDSHVLTAAGSKMSGPEEVRLEEAFAEERDNGLQQNAQEVGAGSGEPKHEANSRPKPEVSLEMLGVSFKAARAVFSPPKPSLGKGKYIDLPRVTGKTGVMIPDKATAPGVQPELNAPTSSIGVDDSRSSDPIESSSGCEESREEANGTAATTPSERSPQVTPRRTAEAPTSARKSSFPHSFLLSSRTPGLPITSPKPRGTVSSTATTPVGGVSTVEVEEREEVQQSSRKSIGNRRLSKSDLFFECTSEVDQLSASDGDSEPDIQIERERQGASEEPQRGGRPDDEESAVSVQEARETSEIIAMKASGDDREGSEGSNNVISTSSTALSSSSSERTSIASNGDTNGRHSPSSPTGDDSATSNFPEPESGEATNSVLSAAVDGQGPCEVGAETAGEGVRGPAGRRRNRRRVPEWELQLGAEAYEDDSSLARFSQGEVDAKIRERLAEQNAAFEKTIAKLKASHEVELATVTAELRQSSNAGDQAQMTARDKEAMEGELAMLSERFGEAAAEARAKTKALVEKETLLDAVTAQLMGLKSDLTSERAAHGTEMQSLGIELDSERKRRGMAESSLRQLEDEFNRLEDDERQKRSAGILKMKRDMQALAQAQFAEANKKHNMVKARLAAAEKEIAELRELVKSKEGELEQANKKSHGFSLRVNALQGDHAESIAEAARREKLLLEELAAFRMAEADRKEDIEGMERERDAAVKANEVSQDALARMAIRNNQLKEEMIDLKTKERELADFCTQALDEVDNLKAINAELRGASANGASAVP